MKPAVGDRIRITGPLMYGGSKPGELDPNAPPIGAEGTVTHVNTWTNHLTQQFDVDWDSGSYVRMLLGEDPYMIIWNIAHRSPAGKPTDGSSRELA